MPMGTRATDVAEPFIMLMFAALPLLVLLQIGLAYDACSFCVHYVL